MKKIERAQLAEIKVAGGCCKKVCAPRRVVSTPASSGSSGGSPVPR
ncbi:MAG: hypothetical protein V4793_37785 [Paraburkholderia tropica]